MIRNLFYIISMVSVMALFSSCADKSLKYIWIHEDGSPYSAMEGRLSLKKDAWDDGRVKENEVQRWSLQAVTSLGQDSGFHNAGSHNSSSGLHCFDLFKNNFDFLGGYEVHFPLPDPPMNYMHWIRMDHKIIGYNFDTDQLWFDYTYGITNPLPQPSWQGSGYFQRILTYTWVNDDPSYEYNIEATLTVNGDAWEDGYLREDEVISWSVTSSVPRDYYNPSSSALGFYDAGSSFPGSSFLGLPHQIHGLPHLPDSSIRAPFRTDGLGSFEVHFPRVTAEELIPPDTPANHDFDHWMRFEQYDLTLFNVDYIPMTLRYGVSNPDPETTVGRPGRFVRSGRGGNPPPVHQLPIIIPPIK